MKPTVQPQVDGYLLYLSAWEKHTMFKPLRSCRQSAVHHTIISTLNLTGSTLFFFLFQQFLGYDMGLHSPLLLIALRKHKMIIPQEKIPSCKQTSLQLYEVYPVSFPAVFQGHMSNPTSETAFLKYHLKQGHRTSSKAQEWSTVGDCTSPEGTPVEKLPQLEVARRDLPLSCCRKSKCRSSEPIFSWD